MLATHTSRYCSGIIQTTDLQVYLYMSSVSTMVFVFLCKVIFEKHNDALCLLAASCWTNNVPVELTISHILSRDGGEWGLLGVKWVMVSLASVETGRLGVTRWLARPARLAGAYDRSHPAH